MSDFDKKPSTGAAPKQGSKVMILAALGALLIGVVAFHLSKGTPQSAGAAVLASPDASADPVALPTETPEQARAALADDPTAKLLRGNGENDRALAQVPMNPFVLNEKWRSTLVKAPDPTIVPPDQVKLDPTRPAVPPPLQTVSAEGFKLSGIFRDSQKMVAIINGNMVTAGMVVGNAKVVEIRDNRVVLRHVNAPAGPTVDLVLQPRN